MKNLLLSLTALFAFLPSVKAQTEGSLISNFHALLESAKTNFINDLDKKIDEDTVTHRVYYEARKPVTGAESFFVHQPSGQNMMVITYDVKGDKAVETMLVVDQYMNELNKMVKSGDYTGEDYKTKNGMDVTDIKDKEGDVIIRYTSTHETQRIYIYGSITTK
jgi:hypothetical protein